MTLDVTYFCLASIWAPWCRLYCIALTHFILNKSLCDPAQLPVVGWVIEKSLWDFVPGCSEARGAAASFTQQREWRSTAQQHPQLCSLVFASYVYFSSAFSHALNVAAVALWAVLTFYKFRKMKTWTKQMKVIRAFKTNMVFTRFWRSCLQEWQEESTKIVKHGDSNVQSWPALRSKIQ